MNLTLIFLYKYFIITFRQDYLQLILLFINNMICHLPYDPPEAFKRRFVEGPLRKDLAQVKTDNWLLMKHRGELDDDATWYLRDCYQAEVAELDRTAGDIVSELQEEGIFDDTLFIVTSDHGECIGHHGFFDHLFNLYDDLLRVPLILRHPKLPQGEVRSGLVQLSDLFPTVLTLLGQDAIRRRLKLPGRTLPLEGEAPGPERPLFFLFRRGSPVLARLRDTLPAQTVSLLDRDLFGVRHGAWKCILDHTGETRLYNAVEDPTEGKNLAGQRKGEQDTLLALLADTFGAAGLPIPDVTKGVRDGSR